MSFLLITSSVRGNYKHLIKTGCLIVFILSFSFMRVVVSAPVILLNTMGQSPLNTDNQNGFIDEVATEAFRRVNVKLQTVHLPAERGLKHSNRGIIDGELVRVKGIDKRYTNLIRVPEKIMDWEFVTFSYKPVSLANGWKDLSGKSVAHINGWKILEKNIPAISEVTKVSNIDDLFNLLRRNRTDYAIYERWGGGYLLREMSMKNVILGQPPLAVKEMFIYLHKKHKALVPQLTKALAAMKKDGSYKKLFNKHLKSFE